MMNSKKCMNLQFHLYLVKHFYLPSIPEGSKYRDLEAVNHNKLLESHKEKKITIIAKNESIVRGSEA